MLSFKTQNAPKSWKAFRKYELQENEVFLARCEDLRAAVWNGGGFMGGMVCAAWRGELRLIGSLIGLSELRRTDHAR